MTIEYDKIVNFVLGNLKYDFNFQYADDNANKAIATNGCGVTFLGDFWYFGHHTLVSQSWSLLVTHYDQF